MQINCFPSLDHAAAEFSAFDPKRNCGQKYSIKMMRDNSQDTEYPGNGGKRKCDRESGQENND